MFFKELNADFTQTKKQLYFWLVGFVAADLLSFLVYYLPEFRVITFFALVVGFLVLSIINYRLATLIALAELFLGSHGYLFYLSFNGAQISIRMALFLIILSIGLTRLFMSYKEINWAKLTKSILPILALGVIAFFAFIQGVMRHYGFSNVFFDANAFLYLGFIIPLIVVGREESFYKSALTILLLASAYLAFKTLILMYLFTHVSFQFFDLDVYAWLRQTRIAELTMTTTAAWRVFMASQIYLLVSFTIVFTRALDKPIWLNWQRVLYLGLMSAGIIASFSRSFWLGFGVAMLTLGGWLVLSLEWEKIIRAIGLTFVAVALGFGFIFVCLKFPWPRPTPGAGLDLGSRLEIFGEAAASSRWNLLPPLWNAVEKNLVMGAGFGSSVTYISNDPRVRAADKTGNYTTAAFEWGYLDLWLKIGLVGLMVFGWGIYSIFRSGYRKDAFKGASVGVLAGLVAVLGVHIGSPYLNHPLGLGLILLLYTWYVLPIGGEKEIV